MPFATSLIPIVGSTAPRIRQRSLVANSQSAAYTFINFLDDPDAKDDPADLGRAQSFGLGLIEISASVSIEFQLDQ